MFRTLAINLILLQYDVTCTVYLPLLFVGKAPHENTKNSIYITIEKGASKIFTKKTTT